MVEHYAEVSGRQVDDIDYYLVLAKWKLAVVLEQGFQRAGDDEKLQAFGPIVARPDARRRPTGRDRTDYSRLSDMRAAVCPAYGGPRWSRSLTRRPRRSAPGQVRVRVNAAAVNFPDVLLIANKYQISVPPPFVPGSEFAGVVVEVARRCKRSRGRRPGLRTGLFGAFAEEVVVPRRRR